MVKDTKNKKKALELLIALESIIDINENDIKNALNEYNHDCMERYIIGALSNLDTIRENLVESWNEVLNND